MNRRKKKHKKKRKGDPNKRCKAQAQAWTDFVTTECGAGPECQAAIACGESLKTCNFSAFVACMF